MAENSEFDTSRATENTIRSEAGEWEVSTQEELEAAISMSL